MPLALEIFVFSRFHANWQKNGSKLRKIWSKMRFSLLIGSKVKAVSQTKNGLPVTNSQGPWELDTGEGIEG